MADLFEYFIKGLLAGLILWWLWRLAYTLVWGTRPIRPEKNAASFIKE